MPMSTITVAGINPGLNILGATQQFNYDQPLSAFQITNSFIPGVGLPSQFNQEFRNNLFSGFRLIHLTTNTDTYGSLTLQSFVNAQSTGSDIIEFDSAGINLFTPLNLTGQPGNSGQVLTSQGAGNAPIWTTNGSGTVTSITAGAGLSGGTITASGTIDITDTTVIPGTYEGQFEVNSKGQLIAASNVLRGIVASLYMSNNTISFTPIAVPNTFVKVQGTTAAPITNNFTATNNKFLYTGANNITTAAIAEFTAKPSVSSVISIAIFKNGTTQVNAAMSNYQLTAGQPISLSVSVDVAFANTSTDYVEVYITSDVVDLTLSVSDMNFKIIA